MRALCGLNVVNATLLPGHNAMCNVDHLQGEPVVRIGRVPCSDMCVCITVRSTAQHAGRAKQMSTAFLNPLMHNAAFVLSVSDETSLTNSTKTQRPAPSLKYIYSSKPWAGLQVFARMLTLQVAINGTRLPSLVLICAILRSYILMGTG